jgi:hypothetical protein
MLITLAMIILSIVLGISYIIAFILRYQSDKNANKWKQGNAWSYRVIAALSFISFRFFRISYSRLFKLSNFSMTVSDAPTLLSATSKLTFASLICNTFPMVIICIVTVNKAQRNFDQTFFCSLDTLLLGFLAGIFLIIDSITSNSNQFYPMKNAS